MEVKSKLKKWYFQSSLIYFRKMCVILGNAISNMKGDAIVTIDFPDESSSRPTLFNTVAIILSYYFKQWFFLIKKKSLY